MSQTNAQLIDPVDGTIVNADINASAAIAGTNISPDFGSQNIVTTGSVGIGIGSQTPSTPQKQLHIAHDSSPRIMLSNDTTGHATPNGTELLLDSGGNFEILQRENLNVEFFTNNSQRMTIDGSGNVGIGTTSPVQLLHIESSSAPTLRIDDSDTSGALLLQQDGANGSALLSSAGTFSIGVSNDNSAATLTFLTRNNERMRIDSSGRAGIGITSIASSTRLALSESSGNAQTLEIIAANNTGAGSQPGIKFTNNSGGNTGGIFADTNSGQVRIQTGGNDTVTINSSQNVGIGTTSPSYKLEVSAETGISGDVRLLTGARHKFIGGGSGNNLELGTYSSSNTSRNIGMVIDSAGRVGIGTTSLGSHQLISEGGKAETGGSCLALKTTGGANSITSDLALYGTFVTPTNDQATRRTADIVSGFSTGNWGNEFIALHVGKGGSSNDTQAVTDERMRITGAGNVGIGTSSPSGRLNLATGASTACELRLTSNNTGSGSGDRGRISVHSSRNDGTAYEAGKIEIDRSNGTEDKAHIMFFTNNGSGTSERMRISSVGAVGIGTTSPNYIFHAKGGIVDQTARFDNSKTGNGDINYIGIGLDTATTGSALFGHTGHTTAGSQAAWMGCGGDDVAGGFGVKAFRGGAVEMKGTLRVNTGTQYGKLHVVEGSFNPGASSWLSEVSYVASGSFGGGYSLLDGSKGYSMYCHGGGNHFSIQHHSSTTAGASGGVSLLNAATSWSSASDERDKENLVTISDAITKIKTLRTVTGNYTWKPDEKHAFLIAQDVQAVLPEAVDIINTYEATENQRLGLRYTEVIPLLTAALQEAVAEIDTLKTKVAALEAA